MPKFQLLSGYLCLKINCLSIDDYFKFDFIIFVHTSNVSNHINMLTINIL